MRLALVQACLLAALLSVTVAVLVYAIRFELAFHPTSTPNIGGRRDMFQWLAYAALIGFDLTVIVGSYVRWRYVVVAAALWLVALGVFLTQLSSSK